VPGHFSCIKNHNYKDNYSYAELWAILINDCTILCESITLVCCTVMEQTENTEDLRQ